jgi:20S proteasome subunit alpha 1
LLLDLFNEIGKSGAAKLKAQELIEMALSCLGEVVTSQQHLKATDLEIGIVTKESPDFRLLETVEIDDILTVMEEKD